MPHLPNLDNWPDGPVIPRGRRLQQQVEAIRALDSREGYSGGLPSDATLVETWWGKIVSKSDDGRQFRSSQTADDERYWVQRQFIQPAKSTYEEQMTLAADVRTVYDLDKLNIPQLDFQKNLKTKTDPAIYSVVNLAEEITHSHALPLRKRVRVSAFLDRDDPRRMRWAMYHEPPWRLQVQGSTWTDSSALGGGVYRVRIMNAPTANFAKASGISANTFGTAGTTDFLAANLQEQDQTTHDIDVSGTRKPTIFPGQILSIDDDEKTVAFAFDSAQWKNGC